MRRTTIKPKILYRLAQEYIRTLPRRTYAKGGRPRTYDDALILTIASLQNLNQYSFREALEYCEDYFSGLPALSTYHDRLSQFNASIAQGFTEYIGKKIVAISKNTPKKRRVFVLDGTGFSYHDSYPMKFFNGMDIRKIRTHVKIGAVMGLAGKRRFVVSTMAGPAYASDMTLIQPLIEQLPPGKGCVLGDKGFDSHRKLVSDEEKTIIGFSMKWKTQDETKEIIRRVYEFASRDKVLFVLGNLISTCSYDEILREPGFEGVLAVVGEGEDALVSIVKNSMVGPIDLNNYANIPNLTYNQSGIIATPAVGRINLKMYPDQTIPDASKLYDSEYKVYAYETSRGCAWGVCSFCSIKHQFGGLFSKKEEVWGWRCYPVEKVLADFRSFAAQGARVFDLKDSEFFGPVRSRNGIDPFDQTAERVEALARGLIEINEGLEEKISINHVSVKVDTIYRDGETRKNKRKRELYELLKEAGLNGVYLGVESGSHEQLRRYCKGSTVEENKVAVQIMRDIGLNLEVGFIFFDGLVTIGELLENVKFIEETELYETPSRLFGSLRIQTCTPYYKIAEKSDLVGEYDPGMMTSRCLFQHEGIQQIEDTFNLWEEPTRKLIKLLPREANVAVYRGDFYFMKDLVMVASSGPESMQKVLASHVSSRHDLLTGFAKEFRDGDILEEYLADAIRSNGRLLARK